MKERSIIFSTDDICAIREQRKTQFVELVKPQPDARVAEIKRRGYQRGLQTHMYPGNLAEFTQRVWKYDVGDRLWVKETWWCAIDPQKASKDTPLPLTSPMYFADWDTPHWKSSFNESDLAWRSATRMPSWASRITLEIERVRVERLQKITEADAIAEGIRALPGGGYGINEPFSAENTALEAFAVLWDSRNGKRAPWASNPWVWVVDFCIVEQ